MLVTCAFVPAVWQVFHAEGLIYMVQEYGEIDLARLLAKHEAARRTGSGVDEIDENFVRLYWQQMLQVTWGLALTDAYWRPCLFRCMAVHCPGRTCVSSTWLCCGFLQSMYCLWLELNQAPAY